MRGKKLNRIKVISMVLGYFFICFNLANGYSEDIKAVDGDLSTSWKGNINDSLDIKLPSSVRINKIVTFFPSVDNKGTQIGFYYKIEVADKKGKLISIVQPTVGLGKVVNKIGEYAAPSRVITSFLNLIKNGGMENSKGDDGEIFRNGDGVVFEDWGNWYFDPDAVIIIENKDIHSGKQAIRLKTTSADGVSHFQVLELQPSAKYSFTGYIKVIRGKANVVVSMFDESNERTAWGKLSLFVNETGNSWKKVTGSFETDSAEKNFHHAQLDVFALKDSEIILDDLFIIPGEISTDLPEVIEQMFFEDDTQVEMPSSTIF